MTDKEVINEFTSLYNDFGSIDKALVEIRKIIAPLRYERLIMGIARYRK